ncbi:MAG: ACP S-malonyltransferase [Ruminococcaceae bacterium]|nr:ACP S-malonyltransferase [Oscillospiraceae bacterium]
MGKLAFLFAGQGAQAPGMGESLNALGGAAGEIFYLAESGRPGTLEDCFNGTAERLAQTDVTQPCVFTVDMAAAAALAEAGVQPDGVAGYSLGELAALCFAGAFGMAEGFALVCRRGELMQAASLKNAGAMAAVLKLPDDKVEALCAGFERFYPVNYNCDGQLTVAGTADGMPAFCAAVKEAGGMARQLPVAGAFHSPFMDEPAAAFAGVLAESALAAPTIPVYANLTGKPYAPPEKDLLAAQMKNPVRWSQSIKQMGADGFDTFIEVGPGKTLTGFVKRILPGATLYNVQDQESLKATLAALKA